jgi:uncharacterized protein (DUF2141 family)
MSARTAGAGCYYHRFLLKVTATASDNIFSGISPSDTLVNYSYKVLRSSLNIFASNPLKSYTPLLYQSGTYANPTITNTLSSTDFVSDLLCTPNWDTSFGTGTTVFAPVSPSTLVGSCTSTIFDHVKHMYTATTSGVGSVTSAYEKTGAQSPMYQFSTAVYAEAAQLITSINGGNPITAGQIGIPIVATGFSAKPTAVTATYASGTKSITTTIDSGGTANNFNISIQDRIEAEDWPINGDTLTFTFTYGSESAGGTQTLVKKATETVLTVSGGITGDPATWTYWLTQDGFTVEGGEHSYTPYGNLILTADGGGTATNAGTFTSWFRPTTGTGAGNVYSYTWNISEAGSITVVSRGQMPSLAIGYGIGI